MERKLSQGNLPEWGLGAMAVLLLVVTGYRSWHFLTTSLPHEYQIIAYAGLFGLDIGALIWAYAWMRAATNTKQDEIALVMFVVDVLGMLATSLADTLLYQQGVQVEMPEAFKIAALWGVPIIIASNAVAAVLYHMASESTALHRRMRRDQAELNALRAEIEREQAYLDQRELMLAQKEKLAAQRLRMVATERGLAQAEQRGSHVDEAAETIAERVRRAFLGHPQLAHSNNGHETRPNP